MNKIVTLYLTNSQFTLLKGAIAEHLLEAIIKKLEPEATELRKIHVQFKHAITVGDFDE